MVKAIPLTCLNSGLLAPNIDLMYFFTSFAISTNPVSGSYNVLFLIILELLTSVYAVATELFLSVRLACKTVSEAIVKSVSFHRYMQLMELFTSQNKRKIFNEPYERNSSYSH